jgi:hypothetical protein
LQTKYCRHSITIEDLFNEGNNNKIASLMANPNRSKKDNENIVSQIIDQLIQKGNNKDLINKIASTVTPQTKGEVAEFQSLICSIR